MELRERCQIKKVQTSNKNAQRLLGRLMLPYKIEWEGGPGYEKMVEGRVKKFYQDVCLLEQPFVKDSSMTIQAYINEMTLKIGEKISVRRFTRYEMGEGLEKRHDNLAEEVEKQMQKKN